MFLPRTKFTRLNIRAPEQILGGEVNKALDIWSFGSLLFEFITGDQLFWIGNYDITPEEQDDTYLLMLSHSLGPLPESLYALWNRSSRYYTSERVLLNNDLYAGTWSLEERFDHGKPADVSDDDAKMVKALLRRILQYDPAKRPTASEILQDPWFEWSSGI
jgi:serine/threonine protein kinase